MHHPSSAATKLVRFRSSKWFLYTAANLAIFTDTYLQSLIIPILPYSLVVVTHVEPQDVQKWTGILVGIHGAGYIVGSPVAGYLADRYSARRLLYMFGLVVMLASTLMFAYGRKIGVLIFGRVLMGISGGFTHSIGTAVLADACGDEASGKVMGFLCLTIAAGLAIGPIAGGALYQRYGYEDTFASAYVLMSIDVILWTLMKERKSQPVATIPEVSKTTASASQHRSDAGANRGASETNHLPQNPQESPCETDRLLPATPTGVTNSEGSEPSWLTKMPKFVILLTQPRMQSAMLGALMSDLFLTAISSTLPLRLKTLFGFNSQSAGIIFLFLMVANFASPFLGALGDRVGAKATITSGYVLLIPCWILLRLVEHNDKGHLAVLYVLLVLIGVGLNLILAPVFSEAKAAVDELNEENPGLLGAGSAYATSFALMNTSYAAGTLIGPTLGSLMVSRIGWGNATMVFGIWSAVCVIPTLYAAGPKAKKNEKKAAGAV